MKPRFRLIFITAAALLTVPVTVRPVFCNSAVTTQDRQKVETPIVIKIVDTRGPIGLLTIVDILFTGAEIMLLAFIVGWSVSFARKKIREALRVTPYESARRELGAVKAALAKKAISPAEYCSKIPSILKSYVKEIFKIGSSEITTADFLKNLNTITAVSDDLRRKAGDLLSFCDLVKFSGYDPSWEELETGAGAAELILNGLNERKMETKPTGKS